jgi:hypothetical protein
MSQNFPVLTRAASSSSATTIQGFLDSAPNTTFRIEFFANTECDTSGSGEGETFLGATNVTTGANCTNVFSVTLPGVNSSGMFLTATATDPDGNTSEFSPCLAVDVFPPGDLNGSSTVTGADSLLINQVLVGLRSNTHPIFAVTGYANGDVNASGSVTGADSLFINQVIVGLRSFITTKVLPGSRASTNTPTPVTIYGVGFPTNGTVTSVQIGAPVNLTLSNVTVLSRERITAVVPVGGGAGTGTVNVVAVQTNGVQSFGRFVNP